MTNETNAALSALKIGITIATAYKSLAHEYAQDALEAETQNGIDEMKQAIALLEASQREAPVAEGEKGHWWCPSCKEAVIPQRVTFQENHDSCGYPVEWIEFTASRPAAESVVTRETIKKVLDEKIRTGGDLYSWIEGQDEAVDAIFALQLPAPQPSRENVVERETPTFEHLEACFWAGVPGPDRMWRNGHYGFNFGIEAIMRRFFTPHKYEIQLPRPPVTEPEGEAVEAWVSVEDGLPEQNEAVLVWDDARKIRVVCRYVGQNFWFDDPEKRDLRSYSVGAVAWQSLPEAPALKGTRT